MNLVSSSLVFVFAAAVSAQTVETVKVQQKKLERVSRLPAEILPYQRVALHARVPGFVEKVAVDRGSVVTRGQVLAALSAPEMAAQLAEADAKIKALDSQTAEAQARAVAAQSNLERLKTAAATPGAVSANELEIAERAAAAAQAHERAAGESARAARAAADAIRRLEEYLTIAAPFDGVITARHVHPGALAGPSSASPMLELEQLSRLRVVVAVPETDVAGIAPGARVSFTVPAHPGRAFQGTVARISRSLDPKTRTMAVELDAANPNGMLAPGMYAEAQWPTRRAGASLLVPPSAVVVTTERSFVIRVRNGRAEYVNVSKGAPLGELVEVSGALAEGDEIVRRGTDEVREGSAIPVKTAAK